MPNHGDVVSHCLFIALVMAKAFLHQIYRLHLSSIGTGSSLVHSEERKKELFCLGDVSLLMSSSYRPGYDGQTGHLNQTMDTFLHCLMSALLSGFSGCHWLNMDTSESSYHSVWLQNRHASCVI